MGKIESDRLESFRRDCEQGNRKIPEADHPGMKRFINPDANTYKDGALAGETKELLDWVASAVLGCVSIIIRNNVQKLVIQERRLWM